MQPLAGITIVEAAQMISAPFATSILSDQGARVIKVEAADGRGDRMRSLGDHRNGMASAFHEVNRGKESISINTKTEAGREILAALIDRADVFVQNFRPGAVDRMGVGADVCRARNPRLIYVSVSGFGDTGPYADQMVYDFVIQGLSGLAAAEGSTDRPRLAKQLVIDKATALTVSQAITAALFERERTGAGQHLEVNMLEAGLQFVWPDGMWNHTLIGDDVVTTPPLSTNYDVHRTLDGYITLNLATMSTWERTVAAIDPALGDDPRFATYADRQRHAAELTDAVDGVLATLTTAEALERLRRNDVPGGAVHTLDAVPDDVQIRHNGSIVERTSATIGPLRQPRPAARFHGRQGEPGDAPTLGQHTDAVLAELGYAPDTIATLRAQAVVA